MALGLIDLFFEFANCLLDDSNSKGFSRIVRRVWVVAVVVIIIGAVAINIVGGIAGYLDVPSDTKTVFIWAFALVMRITFMAFAVALIAAIIQKLGSILGRGTGNTNVHPD